MLTVKKCATSFHDLKPPLAEVKILVFSVKVFMLYFLSKIRRNFRAVEFLLQIASALISRDQCLET